MGIMNIDISIKERKKSFINLLEDYIIETKDTIISKVEKVKLKKKYNNFKFDDKKN